MQKPHRSDRWAEDPPSPFSPRRGKEIARGDLSHVVSPVCVNTPMHAICLQSKINCIQYNRDVCRDRDTRTRVRPARFNWPPFKNVQAVGLLGSDGEGLHYNGSGVATRSNPSGANARRGLRGRLRTQLIEQLAAAARAVSGSSAFVHAHRWGQLHRHHLPTFEALDERPAWCRWLRRAV